MPVKKNFSVSVGIGAPSLMTIFLIISMLSFAVLSYMTSLADYRFAERREERSTAYHQASNESEITLSRMQSVLQAVYETSEPNSFYDNAIKAFGEYDVDPEHHSLTFRTPIRETQDLRVTIRLRQPEHAGDRLFDIIEWRVVQTGDWVPDHSMNLMEGN